MPPRIANPAESAKAQQATAGMTDVKTGAGGGVNRFKNKRPLTRFERMALKAPVDAVFLYNISPIFHWKKDYPGLGTLNLPPRRDDQECSDSVAILQNLVRAFDGGDSTQRFMVEVPIDIAQDFFVCSPEFPSRPENNLLNYGCFYTEGKPLEEFAAEERQKILDEAELKHRNRLHELVAQADSFYNSANMQYAIVEVHKQAALYLQSKGNILELPDWVARRAKLNTTEECRFCGFENKRNVVVCRNCREVLDQEGSDKLKSKSKKKKED